MKLDFRQIKGNILAKKGKIKIYAAAAAVIVIASLFIWLNSLKSITAMAAGESVYIRVTPGMRVAELVELLHDKGAVSGSFGFKALARWNDLQSNLKVGAYVFSSEMTYQEIIDALMSGKTAAVMVTIPEGYSVEQIASLFAEKGLAEKAAVLDVAKNFAPYDYMTTNDDTIYRAEGFLFPDTYEIAHDQDAEAIFKMMADEFDYKFTPEMRQRAQEMNMSIRDVITLASLVEKEARYAEDRPIIAQVFLTRLEIGMPLQSDATIQYLLDAPKEDVLIEDTKMKSPYNTYQNMELPPGPIANPGLDSIKAVLYPADTDYLYFVADRQGHNYYTTSYQEHLDVVDRVR